jgi:hypothetical protein
MDSSVVDINFPAQAMVFSEQQLGWYGQPEQRFSEKVRIFFFNLCGGTLGTAATTGLLYQLRMIGDGDWEENWWNED